MRRTAALSLALPLLLCEALAGDTVTPDCTAMATAHGNLMSGCFSARRELEVTVNDRPHVREVARVQNAGGESGIEVIEKEVLKEGFVMDSENGDMIATVPFRCDGLTRLENDRYRLDATEEPERVEFDYDEPRAVLLPLRWVFETTERFLFRKFRIRAEAVYTDVSFGPCAAEAGK